MNNEEIMVRIQIKHGSCDPVKEGFTETGEVAENTYTIELKRHDGKSITYGDARTLIGSWMINTVGSVDKNGNQRKQARNRK